MEKFVKEINSGELNKYGEVYYSPSRAPVGLFLNNLSHNISNEQFEGDIELYVNFPLRIGRKDDQNDWDMATIIRAKMTCRLEFDRTEIRLKKINVEAYQAEHQFWFLAQEIKKKMPDRLGWGALGAAGPRIMQYLRVIDQRLKR